ncbi:NAD(P)/FAD-dependent oxidoreductase [Microbacterium sp. SSM24]|uniref:NAD(P)/FAD-dependent oxidoreductase n=1 Tax=Microbacterium sp. SSM24 TaxID=2991714 RepID=UPI0022279935|nr:FAD-dependent oxidoreductase [Microbacterium sp. SSM24]MCW3493593.1 FAD-dependent oxidoreductase [Microbacterium sp. SSM24]
MQVLVVGAGYAGAVAAVRLAGRARGRVDVTVVNPRPGFVHRLRMHHFAAGRDVPSRDLGDLLGTDVRLVEGTVVALDADAGRAEASASEGMRTIDFDRVILATGSGAAPAPIPGGELAFGVGDLDSARRLRVAFAALPAGAEVVVVGGGFTGLETVTEFAEVRPDVRVQLVQSGDVAGWFGPRARSHVRETLDRLSVEAVARAEVRELRPGTVVLGDGAEVPADLTVWCGGFAPRTLARDAGIAVDEHGAVITDAALRSISHPTVIAVGDAGHTAGPGGDRYSMSCQFALPSGAHAADLIRDDILGGDGDRPFDLGFVARCLSLGSRAAVLQMTDHDDLATGRALTGRTAVMMKRIQLGAMLPAIASERRMPGLVRWPHSHRVPAEAATPVAG